MNAKGNAYTGDSPIRRRDGSVWRFNFDYTARAALRTEFAGGTKAKTDLDVAAALSDLMQGEVGALATITVIALQRNHPGVTLEEVNHESLPQVPAMSALLLAMRYAIHGAEVPAEPEQGPPAAAAPARPPKKTKSKRR